MNGLQQTQGNGVMITGNMGYIGQVMTTLFLSQSFQVTGLDAGYFRSFLPPAEQRAGFSQVLKDVRDITEEDLQGNDTVIHLAGLSNDPTADLNPGLTHEINFKATARLASLAKRTGVKRFLFSSSCSVYGASDELVTETSKVNPLTVYAEAKVLSERALLELQDEDFTAVVLRSGTAYGLSPRMRLDLVVNALTARAFSGRTLKLSSGIDAWRPLVHVKDISQAFLSVATAKPELVNGQIFNVGGTSANYQIKEVAQIISEVVDGTTLEFAKDAGVDHRTYRVDFTKIKTVLGFELGISLRGGVREIYEFLKRVQFSQTDYNNDKYHTIDYYKRLLALNILDASFRFQDSERAD